MQLVDDWKSAWRWASVQIQTGVVALAAGWAMFPQEWKDAIPKWALVACAAAFGFATITGRVLMKTDKGPE